MKEQYGASELQIILEGLDILNANQIKIFIDLFSLYDVGSCIYPEVIIRKMKINFKKTRILLDELIKEKYLELMFRYYCYRCTRFVGDEYLNYNNIPNQICCEDCNMILTKDEKLTFVYKVEKSLCSK